MKRYISHKYTRGESTMVVYLIDQSIENALLDHVAFERGDQEKAPLTAEKIEEIRQAVRVEVGDLTAYSAQPAILTSPEIRYFLRRLIAEEFPEIAVLSWDELSPDLNIKPLARITLD